MEENKVKVDTRISESDYETVLSIALQRYDGNKSLCLRMLLKTGIKTMRENKDYVMSGKELIDILNKGQQAK